MRALITCVGMDDILRVTLPYNMHHFSEVCVVTTPLDTATVELVRDLRQGHGRHQTLGVYATTAFTDRGPFCKYAALEEALDGMGRTGWIALLDCDVLWPRVISHDQLPLARGHLYSPRRRMMAVSPGRFILPAEELWGRYPLHSLHTHPRWHHHFSGYTQVFCARDPALGKPPWHPTDLPDAGAGDTAFQEKWAADRRVRPGFEVLHIGDGHRLNWRGRVTPRIVVCSEGGQGIPLGGGDRDS